MPVPLDRQNSFDSNVDQPPVADANDGNSAGQAQSPPSDKRLPPRQISFSSSVRPSRSKLRIEPSPHPSPSLGSGVPLGERIHSISNSTMRMSSAVPTALPHPEATPLPVVPMIVLSITMMGEFLSANVASPWILLMVEGFGVEQAEVGLWTGLLVSMFFITQFATSLLWASLAGRFGRRVVLFTSLVGSGVTCIAFGTSKTLAFAFGTRLLQGVFGGAVGVARESITVISDSTNEAQAYAILGFCWGLGGVGGAIIGGVFVDPAEKWAFFQHIPLFIQFPYLLPTMVAASVTISGGLLALTLNRDAGPRSGASTLGPDESIDVDSHTGFTDAEVRHATENTPLGQASRIEQYGSINSGTEEPGVVRLGVPLGDRTWTQSSALSGGSGYGDVYRSRFGAGIRHRTSWVSAVARRHVSQDEEASETYEDNEPEQRELPLVERILLANELTVTSIGDLWVASALTMDGDVDEDFEESTNRFTAGSMAESALESQRTSTVSDVTVRVPPVEPRARSMSASRRTVLSTEGISFRNSRPYSLAISANSQSVPYPAVFQNTGLRSPSPALDLPSEGPDTGGTRNVDVLQPILEGKPFGVEGQSETQQEVALALLPLTMIFQYGLLALHSTTHDQVFMSYLVSKRNGGGLELTSGDFAQLVAIMCLAQIVFQFYLYPTLGPPLGRFSHLAMFRIGGVLMALSYVTVVPVRLLANSGISNEAVLAALTLPTAIRYCGITFSYTAVSVLLNYMSPPHVIGLANGLAQSTVSLARFIGPILGGYLWSFSTHADPEGFAFGFWFCAAFCGLALVHSFTLR